MPEPQLRTMAAQPVASICRTTTPAELPDVLGEVLPTVWAHLEKAGVAPAGPPFSRYLRSTDEEVEVEAGMPVAEPFTGDDTVAASRLPGGRVVVATHVGPYDTLRSTYEEAERWAVAQGLTPSAGPWESYLTDPGEEPDPTKWVTEVYVPLD